MAGRPHTPYHPNFQSCTLRAAEARGVPTSRAGPRCASRVWVRPAPARHPYPKVAPDSATVPRTGQTRPAHPFGAPGTGGNTTCSCILPLRRPTGSRSRGRALQCSPKPNRRYARAGGVLLAWCVPHRRGRGVRTAACGNVSRHGQGAGSPPSSPRAQGRARLPPQVRPPRTWAPLLCVGICIPMAGGVVVARPRTVHLHFTSLHLTRRPFQKVPHLYRLTEFNILTSQATKR